MKRLVLLSTFCVLLLVSVPGAIAETHILEGSLNLPQNSGQGNLQNNAGLSLPSLPSLALPSLALPTLPSGLPTGLPGLPTGLPGLPTGLPGLPTGLPGLPTGLPGLPTGLPGLPVSGLPTGLPDLSTLPLSVPLTLQAPLGLPTL